MSNQPPLISLHYFRPPNRKQTYKQYLISKEAEADITLSTDLVMDTPFIIQGNIILETGSKIIWFTFPDTWHDIGLFHQADGIFTGIYANIITPVQYQSPLVWETTDLFLDIWIDLNGRATVLDEDQFVLARQNEWISPEVAETALRESQLLIDGYHEGTWPPSFISRWNLDRALQYLN